MADYILNKPYAPVTKKHYKRDIGGAYGWWIEQGWALENPAKKVRTPQVVTPEPGILSVEETERLFKVNEKVDPEICGLLALGAFAGMRSSAISKVEYHEIDFAQRGPGEILDDIGIDFAASFQQSNDRYLATRTTTALAPHTSSPEVTLVHFDHAIKATFLLTELQHALRARPRKSG